MKKVIVILALFSMSLGWAQNEENRFMASDNDTEETAKATPETAEAPGPPGGDDLPIDDYIPLLLVAAMGMIVYNTWRKKTLS